MNRTKLTPMQEKFCQEFIKIGNQSEAYRRAYPKSLKWKPESVNEVASTLMANIKVLSRVKALQEKQEQKNEISKEWIFNQLKSVIAKSSSEEEIKNAEGGTGEYKYDSSGVNKAVDTLNKMLGYYAPTKQEVDMKINLDTWLLGND